MIADLKPYPAMKDSGVEWLGEVPEPWEVLPLCSIAKTKSITDQQDRELLSVYLDLGVIRFSDVKEKRTNVTSEDLSKYQAVDPGDLVLNNQQAWRGSVGVSKHTGIVSPAYLVLSLDSKINPDFANLLFRERTMVAQYLIASKGVGSIQRNLYWPHLKRVSIFLPSLPEQAAIVRYLDHVDRRVRRLVRAKGKLIALLAEQKQAIIHRAVTRGLESDVSLKPSGVEWLGEVPEHWDVKPLKFLVPQVTVGIVIQPARLYVAAGIPCLRSLNISSGSVRSDQLVYISPESNAAHRKSQIFAGDIVVVRTGQAGVAAIVTPDFDRANCIDLLIIRSSDRLVSEYLLTYLNSWSARTEVQYRSVGAIQAHYNTGTLANLTVPTPSVEDQREILCALAAELEPLDDGIGKAAREIELLNEYRTRLIADVVTGKLDVREAAAALPGVDPLENDEPDTLDADTEAEPDDLDAIPEEVKA